MGWSWGSVWFYFEAGHVTIRVAMLCYPTVTGTSIAEGLLQLADSGFGPFLLCVCNAFMQISKPHNWLVAVLWAVQFVCLL